MKRLLKLLAVRLCWWLAPRLSRGASILLYHSVGDNPAVFTVTSANFERQLKYLVDNELQVVLLSDLVRRFQEGESVDGLVCLTFDDGCLDNYENVWPLLLKYNLPATIFLPTSLVGRTITTSDGVTLPLLAWKQIKELLTGGLVEFMPHTRQHQELDHQPLSLIAEDVNGSRQELEQRLNGKYPILAYPRGKYRPELFDFLRQNGWLAAVTTNWGLVRPRENVFALPRNGVIRSTSWAEFKLFLSDGLLYYLKLKR